MVEHMDYLRKQARTRRLNIISYATLGILIAANYVFIKVAFTCSRQNEVMHAQCTRSLGGTISFELVAFCVTFESSIKPAVS